MRQSISGVTTSDKYYVTAQLSQPSFSPGVCRFVIKADEQVLVQREFADTDVVFCGRFDASGVFESAAAEFTLTYYCYNGGETPIEVWAAFDSLALFVYPASTPTSTSSVSSSATSSVTPGPTPTGTQLLINNDFESGEYIPWQTQGNPDTVFSVGNGRATVEYTKSGLEKGVYLQYLTPGIRFGQLFRFQFDVDVSILPGNGNLCHVEVWSGALLAWSMEIDASRQDSLDLLLKMDVDVGEEAPDRTMVSLESRCDQPAVVSFDDVYLTVYPDTADSSTSTTSSATLSPSASPARRELLVNNDFDSGSYIPWTTGGSEDVTFSIAMAGLP
jgi:hypothetical protein